MKRIVVGAAIVICAVGSGMAPAAASTGIGAGTGAWRVQVIPEPVRAGLSGVSCPSQADCTAVGGVAEQWSGGSWSEQTIPQGPVAVSCTAPASCTAIGSTSAEQWDGTTWTSQTVAVPAGAQFIELNAVSCESTTNCTAIGTYFTPSGAPHGYSKPLAEHWDGTSWTLQKVPTLADAYSENLTGVSCLTATRCIATGQYIVKGTDGGGLPLAAQWNGTRWSVQTMPYPAGAQFALPSALSCSRVTQCTTVGAWREGDTVGSLIEGWNGTTWTIQQATGGADLRGVSCPTAIWCTAVGVSPGDSGYAEYWDGTTWTTQVVPVPHGHAHGYGLLAVSCLSAFHCTAVGSYGAYGRPLAEHEN
jgi:hypothetical protein